MAAARNLRNVFVAIALAVAMWIAPVATGQTKSRQPNSAPVRVVRVTGPSEFSWTDAAIGGAAVLALVVIVVGLRALLADHHDRRQPTTTWGEP